MKKEYEQIFIEIILFDENDIVTGSGNEKFGDDHDIEKVFEWK